MESVSLDGGATWTPRTIANGSDRLGVACCDPNGSFDTYGNYFLTYLDLRAKKVQVAYSTDSGISLHFLATIDHTDNSNPLANGQKYAAGADQPRLATGPGGTWFVYKLFGTGGQLLQARGLPVTGLGQFGPLTAQQAVPGSKRQLRRHRGRPERPGADQLSGQPRGAGSRDDLEQSRSRRLLGRPGSEQPAPPPRPTSAASTSSRRSRRAPSTPRRGWPTIGRNGAHRGRVYLVYTDEQPDESNNTDIWVRRSDDDGATFSPPVRVNDDTGTASQFNPHVALDPETGYIAVGFHDARNDLGTFGSGDTDRSPNTDAQYFVAVSRDGGASFSANIGVSKGTSNGLAARNGVQYGDYTGLGFARASFIRPGRTTRTAWGATRMEHSRGSTCTARR